MIQALERSASELLAGKPIEVSVTLTDNIRLVSDPTKAARWLSDHVWQQPWDDTWRSVHTQRPELSHRSQYKDSASEFWDRCLNELQVIPVCMYQARGGYIATIRLTTGGLACAYVAFYGTHHLELCFSFDSFEFRHQESLKHYSDFILKHFVERKVATIAPISNNTRSTSKLTNEEILASRPDMQADLVAFVEKCKLRTLPPYKREPYSPRIYRGDLKRLHRATRKLDGINKERDTKIAFRYFCDGLTYQELAQEFSLSSPRIWQIIRKIFSLFDGWPEVVCDRVRWF